VCVVCVCCVCVSVCVCMCVCVCVCVCVFESYLIKCKEQQASSTYKQEPARKVHRCMYMYVYACSCV